MARTVNHIDMGSSEQPENEALSIDWLPSSRVARFSLYSKMNLVSIVYCMGRYRVLHCCPSSMAAPCEQSFLEKHHLRVFTRCTAVPVWKAGPASDHHMTVSREPIARNLVACMFEEVPRTINVPFSQAVIRTSNSCWREVYSVRQVHCPALRSQPVSRTGINLANLIV